MSELDDYRVRPISVKLGRKFILQHHYSKGCAWAPQCYGLFDERDELVGAAAIQNPCSEAVRASVWGPENKQHVTELHRLVLVDSTPRFAESWFISRLVTRHKKYHPEIWGILAYSDQAEGHIGTVYQAVNALYLGGTAKQTFYRDQHGRLRHPRQGGYNISRHDALCLGWTPVLRPSKHKYLILTPDDRKHRKQLLADLEPREYPKAA